MKNIPEIIVVAAAIGAFVYYVAWPDEHRDARYAARAFHSLIHRAEVREPLP